MSCKLLYLKKMIHSLLGKVMLIEKEPNYSTYFNTPIKFARGNWYVNERIVELAFAHKHIELDEAGKRVLEFGCTKSDLAIQLASLGFEVVGLDLREYPFTHPRLKFYRKNLMDFEDDEGFDYITAISSIEHVGLGAYGEKRRESDLYEVTSKLCRLLKPSGKIIVTVPFGQAYEDGFLRSFTHEEILSLFSSEVLNLTVERFYHSLDLKFWQPCDIQQAQTISNSKTDRGLTGVNCVGCFVWERTSAKGDKKR